MSTNPAQPARPSQTEDLSVEDLKRIYEEHVAAAEEDCVRVSRQELLEEGLRKRSSAR